MKSRLTLQDPEWEHFVLRQRSQATALAVVTAWMGFILFGMIGIMFPIILFISGFSFITAVLLSAKLIRIVRRIYQLDSFIP